MATVPAPWSAVQATLQTASRLLRPPVPAGGEDARELPSVVEIEVNSRCNRRCSYCPVSLDPAPAVPRWMEREVFRRLIGQLSDIDFGGRISYHFYNEPLLRRDLEDLAGEAAAGVPRAIQVLYTNGDLLTAERYRSLRAAGIGWFVVTRHDSDGFPERPGQTVLTPDDLTLTNRGGSVGGLEDVLDLPCWAPSEILVVTVTGDVVLCYEDARRENVFGNVLDQSLADIWNGDRLRAVREALRRGDRRGASATCSRCDNRAHPRPGLSVYSP